MAEIKSTMDLVMERTRNLTMSEDDRREQSAAEFRAGVNGLVQKYIQGDLNVGRFEKELSRFEKDFPGSGVKSAAAEIAKRIDPAEDNLPLLKLLREVCGKDVAGIENLLRTCIEKVVIISAEASGRILEELRKTGISGSAIVPNRAADAALVKTLQDIIQQFRCDMATEIDRLG